MFDQMKASWVTLNPYMGYDSLRPFIEYKEKGVFILCLTSNPGSKDFQILNVDGKPLYQIVAEKVAYWNKDDNCGLVVGATNPEQLKELRAVTGNMPLLIPGVGAQGGSLEKAATYGTDNFTKTALINVSRSVLYASKGSDFAERACAELCRLNQIVDSVRGGVTNQPVDSQTPAPSTTNTESAPQPQQSAQSTNVNTAETSNQPQSQSHDNHRHNNTGQQGNS
jgi:orotidine-5'-phosphate decarboxylase